MSDIVRFLRDSQHYNEGQKSSGNSEAAEFYQRAADEIERLRALNAKMLAALRGLMDQPTKNPIDMSPTERNSLWQAHQAARVAISRAEA